MIRDEYFMDLALKQAEKAESFNEVPIGAVVTLKDGVIAQAYNQVETLSDPTAHAEMLAIRQAVQNIGYKHLYDCNLYVTLEPCAMCAGAMILARINRLIFGASDLKTGASGSVFDIAGTNKLNHKIQIVKNVRDKECSSILTTFFKKLRNNN